jgi:hypothetical protein
VSYSNPPLAAARKSADFKGLQRESCQLKTALGGFVDFAPFWYVASST